MGKANFKFWWPATIWAVGILIVSSIPNLSTPSLGFTFADKVAHFVEYLVLSVLIIGAFLKEKRHKPFLVVLVICSIFGILDELHQSLVPGRTTDILDMLADILGSGAGTGIVAWIKSRFDGR